MPENTDQQVIGCCPACGPDRHAKVLVTKHDPGKDKNSPVEWCTTFRILECGGCKKVYVERTFWFSEDWPDEVREPKYWPAYMTHKPPEWVEFLPETLFDVMTEVYQAAANDMPICTAIAIRASLDTAAVLLKVPNTVFAFDKKFDFLQSNGYLSASEREVLEVVVEAGNASAHRAWKPNPKQIKTLIKSLETFIHRALVLPSETRAMKKSVPKKPKKKTVQPNKNARTKTSP